MQISSFVTRNVVILLGVGCLHRLSFLGARQLWTDELMQARIIKSASAGEIISRLKGRMDLASPLDFFAQRGVTALLGNETWALRLHAAIFGVLSIWIFYRIARFFFSDRTALYSSVLFAFYPLAYHYSLEGRPYSLLLMLSLLSYDLLLRQVHCRRPSSHGWLVFFLVSTLLLYTSFLGSLILCSQGVGLLLATLRKPGPETSLEVCNLDRDDGTLARPDRRHLMIFLAAASASTVLFAPWIGYMWAHPHISPASEIANPKLIPTLFRGFGGDNYTVAALLMLGAALGTWVLLRRRCHDTICWLLSWLLVPIQILLLVEIRVGYFFSMRHLLHASPPLILLAGYGASSVDDRIARRRGLPPRSGGLSLTYAVLMICLSIWVGWIQARSEPADWIGTAVFLDKTVKHGDVVLMPKADAMLEYYVPRLASFQTDNLSDVYPAGASPDRRIVVCYESMSSDPCRALRDAEIRGSSWTSYHLKGFTIFISGE
jgi:uncharacterized membrane protein